MDRRVLGVLSIIVFTAGLLMPIILLNTLNQQRLREAPATPPGSPSTEAPEHEDITNAITRYVLMIYGARSLLEPTSITPVVVGSVVTGGTSPISTSVQYQGTPRSMEYSTTNIQVTGVDEHDIVKTNGNVIVIARSRDVVIIDTTSNTVSGYINVSSVKGLYLVNDTLVLIREYVISPGQTPIIDVLVYSISILQNPVLLWRVNITGYLAGSRLVNNYLYVIGYMNSYIAESVDGKLIINTQIPLVNGKPLPLERIMIFGEYETYIVVLALDVTSGVYSVSAFLGGIIEWIYMVPDRLYVAWRPPISVYYISLKILEYMLMQGYITREEFEEYKQIINEGRGDEVKNRILQKIPPHFTLSTLIDYIDETTFLVLDISKLEVSCRGLFKVPGNVLDQFAMEEYSVGGDRFMVIATTLNKYRLEVYAWRYSSALPQDVVILVEEHGTGTRVSPVIVTRTVTVDMSEKTREIYVQAGWFVNVIPVDTSNNVYIVDEKLNIIANLTDLARSERIFAARLIKNILYLVTFRLVDPLFAIDLSNPHKPRVLGYLKIPGFSEYLHPLSEDRLLGIGLERFLKISLFDISDPTNMSEVAKLLITVLVDSELFRNHRAFMIDPRYEYFAFPVTILYTKEEFVIIEGFIIVKYSLENNMLTLFKVVNLEKPMRALYIGDTLYLIGYSRTLIFKIPEFIPQGEITY